MQHSSDSCCGTGWVTCHDMLLQGLAVTLQQGTSQMLLVVQELKES